MTNQPTYLSIDAISFKSAIFLFLVYDQAKMKKEWEYPNFLFCITISFVYKRTAVRGWTRLWLDM